MNIIERMRQMFNYTISRGIVDCLSYNDLIETMDGKFYILQEFSFRDISLTRDQVLELIISDKVRAIHVDDGDGELLTHYLIDDPSYQAK